MPLWPRAPRGGWHWAAVNAARAYVLGPHFQLGLQLAVGILLVALPTVMG
jgi:hypothetical protein